MCSSDLFDDERLVLRQDTLAQDLEVAKLSDVDQGSVILGSLVLDLVRDQGPELVDVDDWAIELVTELVEVTHTDFTEEAGMVLVE